VIFVADQNNGAFFAGEFQRFQVHLGDQGTGSVDDFQGTRLGLIANGWRHTVGTEYQYRAVRYRINGFDKNRSTAAQLLHNIRVMNDFVMHVHRRPISFERQLNNIHGAHYPGTEAPGPHPQ